MLSAGQITEFKRDGYLVVRAMYSKAEMQTIGAWTDEIAAESETVGQSMKYFEPGKRPGSRILSRVENFVPYHEGFSELITRRRMLQAVDDLFAEPSVLFKDKINFKLPGADGFRAHQDVQAGWVLYITYNRTSEGDHRVQYYADKRKNYPPDIEREPGKDYAFKV